MVKPGSVRHRRRPEPQGRPWRGRPFSWQFTTPDLITLLASRVLIGLGTSCAYPTTMLLISRRAREAGLDRPPGGVLGGLQTAGTATASLGLHVRPVLPGAPEQLGTASGLSRTLRPTAAPTVVDLQAGSPAHSDTAITWLHRQAAL